MVGPKSPAPPTTEHCCDEARAIELVEDTYSVRITALEKELKEATDEFAQQNLTSDERATALEASLQAARKALDEAAKRGEFTPASVLSALSVTPEVKP